MSDWEGALRHAEVALAMNEAMDARPWLAHTQHECAAVLLQRGAPGDRDRAQQLLQQASAAAREMAMDALTRRIEEFSTPG